MAVCSCPPRDVTRPGGGGSLSPRCGSAPCHGVNGTGTCAGDKFWGHSWTRGGGSGMLMAGPTLTQMDSGHPKRVREVPTSPSPLSWRVSDPPGSCAHAAMAASTRGCREREAPGAARRQRRSQRSHLITGASCPHFHSQNPWASTGLAACGRDPAGTLLAPGETHPVSKPLGKGTSASPEPGPRPAAPQARLAEPGMPARGSPHLPGVLAKRPAGRRAQGTPSPRGKLSWFSSSQGRLNRRHRNAAACGVSVAPWLSWAPGWGPRDGDPRTGRGRAGGRASC